MRGQREQEVQIRSGEVTLTGALAGPTESSAAIVICIHGTGPLDRDENMPGQRLDIFNTVAHYLGERGISSLRYDKRGTGASTGDYYTAGHVDLLADVLAVIDYARGTGHGPISCWDTARERCSQRRHRANDRSMA